MRNAKICKLSFQIGYIFYYWDYYKIKRERYSNTVYNINTHSGFEPHELYIELKYSTLKEEILHNKIPSSNVESI